MYSLREKIITNLEAKGLQQASATERAATDNSPAGYTISWIKDDQTNVATLSGVINEKKLNEIAEYKATLENAA